MISTDITGSAGGDASQVFNLLAVVANPDTYAEKLKAIVEATEEHKKYLALVAPASEIIQIRESIEADKAYAKQLVDDAEKQAKTIKAQAKDEAEAAVKEASIIANQAKQDAADSQIVISDKLKTAEMLNKELQNKVTAAGAAIKASEAKQLELQKALEETLAEKESYVKLQKDMSEKVKAFAEDLLK